MSIREEVRFHEDVQAIFKTEAGQRVLTELELRCCRKTFDDNPYRMGYNCGRSDLVMFLKQLTEEHPDEVSKPQAVVG